MSTFPHFATNAAHVGQEPEQWNSMDIVPPISLTSTFIQEEPDNRSEYFYSRVNNPTRQCVEKCIAVLEGGKHAIVFSSGLAATHSITMLLEAGDHLVRMDDVYGGTSKQLRQFASRMGINVSIADFNDTSAVEKVVQPQTRLVWMETPTNPCLQLIDLDFMIGLLRKIAPSCITVLDNTFSTPYFQRPLDFGVDIVMHSVTKYMNGHADVLMGAAVTNNDQFAERLRAIQNVCGSVPSPVDCFLVNRGLKTLHLRMKEHMKNGLAVAKFLEGNPRVEKVLHPGLPSHPQHELAKKQMKGYSGMVTFYIKGGLKEAKAFIKALKLFRLAFSLGGYESLSELPTAMTHVSVPREEREKVGITDNMIRLSVGLEDEEDLIQDLDNALKIAVP